MFTKLKTHFNSLSSMITAITVGVFVSGLVAFAAWNNPTANPTGGNTPPPIDSGASDQAKAGGLSLGKNLTVSGVTALMQSVTAGNLALNAAGTYANALLVPNGKVGIGTLTPDATLQVRGTTKVLGVPSGGVTVANTVSGSAASDGFYNVWIEADDSKDRCEVVGLSGTNDSSDNPHFAQTYASAHYDIESSNVSYRTYVRYGSFMLPVWKGYAYSIQFTDTNGTCKHYAEFIPLGQTNNK